MRKKLWILLGLVSMVAWAAEEEVIGRVTAVEGLVTLSSATSITNAVVDAKVVDKMRVVTSSSGTITMRIHDSCEITLQPNQALTVEDGQACGILIAGIESISDQVAGFILPTSPGVASGLGGIFIAAGTVAGLGLLNNPAVSGQ